MLALRLGQRPLGGRLRRRPAGRRGDRSTIEVPHPLTGETDRRRSGSATARSPRPASTGGCGARRTARRAITCSTRRRRAGLDRRDRCHRARADRARGRDARQGRAAERAGRRRRWLKRHGGLIVPTTAPSTTTACPAAGAGMTAGHEFWLISRSAGVVALVLVAVVGADRADARRRPRRPARTPPRAGRLPRADRARRPDRDRRARRRAARRRIPEARPRPASRSRSSSTTGRSTSGSGSSAATWPRSSACRSTPAAGSAASAGATCTARRRSSTSSA